ncbi:unnamed protein product [Blepharisma stoltei]|uniref:Ankyrin repeat protein n=1 Tax=Blepharisma stoltei TaxID=1481888 RepID=A0AAU9KD85_9CILI|nr:unnamed protein product [Blepharisma stoltei]
MDFLVRFKKYFSKEKLTQQEENQMISYIKAGNRELLNEILETKKIDDNYQSRQGLTPMIYAAYYNQPDIIDYLVNKGFSIEKTGKNDDSPLIRASYYKRFQAAEKLLELGADPNIKNQDYPLMQAIFRQSDKMAELLIKYNADINLILNRIKDDFIKVPPCILQVFNRHQCWEERKNFIFVIKFSKNRISSLPKGILREISSWIYLDMKVDERYEIFYR